jgi:hypothetical protein
MPNKKVEILAAIHRLIDEQMGSLNGKLTPHDAAQYRRRKQRTDQLLMRISLNGFKMG